MTQLNPYQPPQHASPVNPFMPQALGGVWRTTVRGIFSEKTAIVMHKAARLPDICVKSNQQANGGWLKRNLTWHHPAIALSILAAPLIYIVLALVMSKRATIYIGLSRPWRSRRRIAIAAGWVIGLGGVVVFFAAIPLLEVHDAVALLFLVGFIIGLAGLIIGQYASRMVRPHRITDDHVWLVGIHPEFAARFPDWPYRD